MLWPAVLNFRLRINYEEVSDMAIAANLHLIDNAIEGALLAILEVINEHPEMMAHPIAPSGVNCGVRSPIYPWR
jgi:hypothetical protein